MSLLVVGTLGFDSVETPFGRREDTLGGSASFLSIAASYFTDVRMVGVIGEDFPDAHLELYRSRSIDTSGVQRIPGRTFRWRGYYDTNLQSAHTLETHLNVLESFEPSLPEHYRDTKFVVLGNFDPRLQLAVLDQLDAPQLVAADTMNFWIEGANKKLRECLERVDLLSVNDGEARMLSGQFNLVKAAAEIRKMGPRILVIKRGEHGATVFTEDGIFMAPAFPILTIQDPTGAGDSFAGGMMGYIARRGNAEPDILRQATVMGSALASFAVEDFSLDRFRTLTTDEIRLRFFEFQNLVSFEVHGTTLWDDGP